MDQQSYGPPSVLTYLVSVSLLTVKVEKKVSPVCTAHVCYCVCLHNICPIDARFATTIHHQHKTTEQSCMQKMPMGAIYTTFEDRISALLNNP
jgi:hypothetical protein